MSRRVLYFLAILYVLVVTVSAPLLHILDKDPTFRPDTVVYELLRSL